VRVCVCVWVWFLLLSGYLLVFLPVLSYSLRARSITLFGCITSLHCLLGLVMSFWCVRDGYALDSMNFGFGRCLVYRYPGEGCHWDQYSSGRCQNKHCPGGDPRHSFCVIGINSRTMAR